MLRNSSRFAFQGTAAEKFSTNLEFPVSGYRSGENFDIDLDEPVLSLGQMLTLVVW